MRLPHVIGLLYADFAAVLGNIGNIIGYNDKTLVKKSFTMILILPNLSTILVWKISENSSLFTELHFKILSWL